MESFDVPDLPVVEAGPLDDFADALALHARVVDRLWARDHTLWRDDPTEIADRLGWLDAPEAVGDDLPSFDEFAQKAVADGLTDCVVIGMGGSSLFPDVLARTFDATRLRLHVLDSTHPAAVARALALPAASTLFSVASKSGSTLETRSHLEAAWASRVASLDDPGSRFVAITDPGSELDALAEERRFRGRFLAPPDVGGRFSAMTPFGLVPAALMGVDVEALVDAARAEVALSRVSLPQFNPGYVLGVFLATAVAEGRDKVTLRFGGASAPLADWVEQLVAESLGKDGVSVVPVAGEVEADPDSLVGEDRVHVCLGDADAHQALVAAGQPVFGQAWHSPFDLGAQVVRWEVATAVAGALLGLHPFDQPDVASAKAATSEVLSAGLTDDVVLGSLDDALDDVRPGDVVALTAFVDPGGEFAVALPRVQARLRARTGAAVTVGLGPRYLHSTGQLHKGGSDRIVVLQVVDDAAPAGEDVPGRAFDFRTLLLAQAEGDLAALHARGRRAHRVPAHALLDLGPA